jgi:sugar transferase EpsL
MKRLFDFVMALLVLLILWPVILITGLLVRYNLGKPVLFSQLRPGLHSKAFNMYKFRSMSSIYDKNGVLLPDSERMTAFGAFLRQYSLDELPQLFNVIKGELSLVGPRPLLM